MPKFRLPWLFIAFWVLLAVGGMAVDALYLFLALFVHELGHVFVVLLSGYRVKEFILYPFGCSMELDQMVELKPEDEARIALAGPAANLLASLIIIGLSSGPGISVGVQHFFRYNLVLMGFNLLPALPMDGGRLARARLARWLTWFRATRIVLGFGWVCGLALLGVAVFSFNLLAFAAGLFLLYNAYTQRKQLLIPLVRYALARKRQLASLGLEPAYTLMAGPGVKVNDVLKQIRLQRCYHVVVLDGSHRVAGHLSEMELLGQLVAGGGSKLLGEVLKERR